MGIQEDNEGLLTSEQVSDLMDYISDHIKGVYPQDLSRLFAFIALHYGINADVAEVLFMEAIEIHNYWYQEAEEQAEAEATEVNNRVGKQVKQLEEYFNYDYMEEGDPSIH
tara:strand:+ start:564 stop:896 length:333 start_codon:yes stop_codon:yes gene_type:complete